MWKKGNGSLFTYLLATVMENSKENKMSSELPISRLKMGDRKQGNPRDPEGVERGYPCLRPPIFDREIDNLREFHFINCLT